MALVIPKVPPCFATGSQVKVYTAFRRASIGVLRWGMFSGGALPTKPTVYTAAVKQKRRCVSCPHLKHTSG